MSKSASWMVRAGFGSSSPRRRGSRDLRFWLLIPAKAGIQCLCSSSRARGSSDLASCFQEQSYRLRRVTFLCWHKEKSPKESALCEVKSVSADSAPRGFSDSPFPAEKSGPRLRRGRSSVRAPVARKQHLLTLARSGNGVHPCTPPFGSACGAVVHHAIKNKK